MERRKAEELGSVIMRYLRLQGLEAPLNEYRLIEAWPTVAGSAVAAYTDSLRIYNQKLYVKLKSPALRANLMMERGRLVRSLNEAVGASVIVDIVFT